MHFLDLLLVASSIHNLVDKSVHNLVLGDNHRLLRSDLNKSRHFNYLLYYFLHLVNLGNFMLNSDYLLVVDWHLNDPFFNSCHRHWLLPADFNFFYLF